MIKNTAGQKIGAKLTQIADGLPFTGTVTIFLEGDNGPQTIGSVGAGVCTHKGKGSHTYLPSQAETNYDHIKWIFEGTGAITACVQLYTDTAATPSDVENELTSYGALQPTVIGRTLDVTAAGTAGIDWANVENPTTPLDLENTTISEDQIIASVTGSVGSVVSGITITALDVAALDDIADAILKRDFGLITGEAARSLLNAARYLRNKRAVVAGTLTVTKEDDSTTAWTAVTVGTPGAAPITSVDPA